MDIYNHNQLLNPEKEIDLNELKRIIKNVEERMERFAPVGIIPRFKDVGTVFIDCRLDIILLAKLGLDYLEQVRDESLSKDCNVA